MNFAETVRLRIEASSLEDARRGTIRMIRLAAKKEIWRHAQLHWIVDFDDLVVTQRHRDFRDTIISRAQTQATNANAATTIPELLVVFDVIAPFL